jgi:hypothetical protein
LHEAGSAANPPNLDALPKPPERIRLLASTQERLSRSPEANFREMFDVGCVVENGWGFSWADYAFT